MRRALIALLAVAALASSPAAAPASPEQAALLRPVNLHLEDPEAGSWTPVNDFWVAWEPPAIADQGFPVSAVHYEVRDRNGAVVVPETRLPGSPILIDLQVPRPGIFTVRVWLDGPGGESGPAESAELRFDDVRPNPALPIAPRGWVADHAPVPLRFEHPAAPLPVSALRGYAFSVDSGEGSLPCAGADRCTAAETDLRGGIGGDSVWLTGLAEGIHVVRAVAVSGSGLRSELRSATVRIDTTKPEVALSGVPRSWSDGPVRLVATSSDALSGVEDSGPGGAFTAVAIDAGPATVTSGSTASAVVAGEGIHSVAYYGRDAAGNSTADMATVRIDATPPLLSFAGSQDPDEPERIEAEVADSLSGVDLTRGTIALRPAGSRARFEPLPTDLVGGRLVARWDSDSFPAGTYEFRAGGYDLAGNAGVSSRRVDGSPMRLTNPLKAPTRIEAGFGGHRLSWNRCSGEPGRRRCRRETIEPFAKRPASRTVPSGRAVAISGRLSSDSGAPLAGMPVEVIEAFDAGARPAQRARTIQTDRDGYFSARLAPGPGRRVEAVFGGDRLRGRGAAPGLRLDVLAAVRFGASARTARVGGPPVVFRGRVGDLGAPHPAGGRPVELQFRVPGGAWSEFRTVQTDRRGRFHYPYSFSDDDSRGIRFQFRAFAPAVEGWPYEPAFSAPVFVTGR